MVRPSRAETNRLFFAGDVMVSWPTEGSVPVGNGDLERSGMFVSEVAARSEGLKVRYKERVQAERAADSLRTCLTQSGFEEER